MGTTTQPIKNKEHLLRFRNYYKDENFQPRNYALIVFGLNSALRIGDILSLRWNKIYNNSSGGYYQHITVMEEKTGKRNTVAVNKALTEALELYRNSLTEFNAQQYLFTSQKYPTGKLSRSQAFRIIKKAAVSCGMEQCVSCHSLRKTFGYYAWKNGFPPALLMKIYNHSSYEITKQYLCIDQLEKDEVYMKNNL